MDIRNLDIQKPLKPNTFKPLNNWVKLKFEFICLLNYYHIDKSIQTLYYDNRYLSLVEVSQLVINQSKTQAMT